MSVCKLSILQKVMSMRVPPLDAILLQSVSEKLLVQVLQKLRLHQKGADDAEESDEANRRAD